MIQVWNIRVDISIINHDGNLVDCASIAVLAALSHFHRPDVTSTGEEIIIHPFTERDPLPLTMHHYPVCVSFLTFESRRTVMDPTYVEERVGVAHLTLGINSYSEICSLDFNYLTKTMTIEDVIAAVSHHAVKYASKLIQQIKESVAQDVQARYKKDTMPINRFDECILSKKITTMHNNRISIRLRKWNETEKLEVNESSDEDDDSEKCHIVKYEKGSADLIIHRGLAFGEGGPSTWQTSDSEDEKENDIEHVTPQATPDTKKMDVIELDESSEEEVTELLDKKDII